MNSYRPYNYFTNGKIYSPWPEHENEIVQFGPYYLRWKIVTEKRNVHSFYHKLSAQEFLVSKPEISIDKNTWHKFNSTWIYQYANSSKGIVIPSWFKYEELKEHILEAKKLFMRNRAKEQKKIRDKKNKKRLEKEAKKTGISTKELEKKEKAEKSKTRNKKILTNKANKAAKDTNNRMQIAVALKSLRDAIDELDTKINDINCNLKLSYTSNRLADIKNAERAIKNLREVNKKKPIKTKI